LVKICDLQFRFQFTALICFNFHEDGNVKPLTLSHHIFLTLIFLLLATGCFATSTINQRLQETNRVLRQALAEVSVSHSDPKYVKGPAGYACRANAVVKGALDCIEAAVELFGLDRGL